MKKLPFPSNKVLSSILCLSVFCTTAVIAGPFTAGSLVVVQVGDGIAALNANATAGFLKEFSIGGTLLQTINLPTGVSGLNQPLTLSGSATSEGFLALSADSQYLMMGGYGAAPGTVGVVAAAPSAVSRVVGRIDMFGNVDTTTALGDAYSGSNIRSATSTDGTSIWTAGNGGSGLGSTAGTRSTTYGTTTSVQLNSTTSNNRVVNIFNGQLYVSTSSGTNLGINTVGFGLPTTAGSGPLTLLPGMPTAGTHSSYDFWFKDANTLYVADDGSAASGGGIQKWLQSGGTWSLAYTLLNNGTTTTGVRGLAGTVDGSGNAVLFGTSGNTLLSVTDTGAGAVGTTLATAAANTAFRGVEFIPAPEPATGALVGLGILALVLKRRRSR